jgi:hypothetical protein
LAWVFLGRGPLFLFWPFLFWVADFNKVWHKSFRWPSSDLLGPEKQHTGLSKLWSRLQFGTKATGTHRALLGIVSKLAHWMQHFPTGTHNNFNSTL